MNLNGLFTGVGRVKDATIAIISRGSDAASAATQQKNKKTQGEDITRLINKLPSISII
jgi:hypothetical protein